MDRCLSSRSSRASLHHGEEVIIDTVRLAVFINALLLMFYGLWLMAPWWNVFEISSIYNEMSMVAPEWLWGLIALMAGVIKFIGALHNRRQWLRISSMAGFLMWGVIAACYLIAQWHSPTWIIALFLSIQAAHHYLMVK